MTLDTFDGLLKWPELNAWIETQDIPGKGPVTSVRRLTGGSQNSVFLMEREGGRFVLRRPPKHPRPNSNATMTREARVLSAIKGSGVPHPEFYAVCEDPAVLGVSFYAMAPLEGFSPGSREAMPPGYVENPDWRREMGPELMRASAKLAAVDHEAVGLADFGKAENWHARQVERWLGQLQSYRDMENYDPSEFPHVDEIGRWLTDNLPSDRRIGIIHGDYQFPNVMFSATAPKISGLIDWELSTLGDPMLDLGWVLTSWLEEGDPPGREPQVTPWRDFVTRKDLVKMYGELTGRDMSEVSWFFVLACFKLASILEGSYARAKAGKAPMEMGAHLHAYALWLIAKARQEMAAAG